jgi:hypothetical protein
MTNVFLQGKVHLPHPTKTVYNSNRRQWVTSPLCGQRSRRFYPGAITAEATCVKCLAAAAAAPEES